MPIGASLGISDAQDIVRNGGEGSRNLLLLKRVSRQKDGLQQEFMKPSAIATGRKIQVLSSFFKRLRNAFSECRFPSGKARGTSWNAARCQPIETKETLI
ncbi:hypothetical protein ACVITL_003198 [Rhizobium pisi]|nr:hypothetical protein [Rhizobium pisi]RSB66864.1 hypothetical protein EFD55_21905 [Rhizobium pisi]